LHVRRKVESTECPREDGTELKSWNRAFFVYRDFVQRPWIEDEENPIDVVVLGLANGEIQSD
jgi:hypothetical protein